jgi:hypothetical protein
LFVPCKPSTRIPSTPPALDQPRCRAWEDDAASRVLAIKTRPHQDAASTHVFCLRRPLPAPRGFQASSPPVSIPALGPRLCEMPWCTTCQAFLPLFPSHDGTRPLDTVVTLPCLWRLTKPRTAQSTDTAQPRTSHGNARTYGLASHGHGHAGPSDVRTTRERQTLQADTRAHPRFHPGDSTDGHRWPPHGCRLASVHSCHGPERC